MRETIQPTQEASGKKPRKWCGYFFILGVFLVLHTLFLRQADLEKPLAPIHLAMVSALGAFLFGAGGLGARCFGARGLSLVGIALASGLISLGFSLIDSSGLVLGAGWPALIVWSSYSTLRGGL